MYPVARPGATSAVLSVIRVRFIPIGPNSRRSRNAGNPSPEMRSTITPSRKKLELL